MKRTSNPLKIDVVCDNHVFMIYKLLPVTWKYFFLKALELLENLEEIFPCYCIFSDIFSRFKSLTTS